MAQATFRQQRGLTPIATLAILILVGFGLFLLFKLVPVYLEYFNVASSVNSLKEVADLGQRAKKTSVNCSSGAWTSTM